MHRVLRQMLGQPPIGLIRGAPLDQFFQEASQRQRFIDHLVGAEPVRCILPTHGEGGLHQFQHLSREAHRAAHGSLKNLLAMTPQMVQALRPPARQPVSSGTTHGELRTVTRIAWLAASSLSKHRARPEKTC